MTVKCVRLTNGNRETVQQSPWRTLGREYTVLAIEVGESSKTYRMFGDNGNGPALFPADEFTIVDAAIPGDWTVVASEYRGNLILDIQPAAWQHPGFWTKYYDREADAVALFEEHAPQSSNEK